MERIFKMTLQKLQLRQQQLKKFIDFLEFYSAKQV